MEHVIDPSRIHHAWNRDREPTLSIADGDSVRFALRMAGAEQIHEGDSYADTNFIADQIYWLLGPVFVEGARPETHCAWTSCRYGLASGGGAAPSRTSVCSPPIFPSRSSGPLTCAAATA